MVNIAANNTVNRTIHLSSIIRAQYASGRISLPQNGGLYSRFKHIQGVPSSSSASGYSVNKLQMIDQLIDRLVELKGAAAGVRSGESDQDALVAKYATELATAIRSADAVSPSLTAGMATPGMLFSLVA